MNKMIIERNNFKQNRLSYGIKLEDISKKSGLAISTISAYERLTSKYTETRTRDNNAQIIDRALCELIKEKLDNTFPNSISQKEDKVVEESVKKLATNIKPEYDRVKVGNKINKYCRDSFITVNDFCNMCGISKSTFSDSTCKSHPYMYDITLHKICKATGWDIKMLINNEDIPVENKPDNKDKVHECINSIVSNDGNVESIKDEKYTYENGEYFYEYTVVKRIKMKITKEKFLKDISKKEEK